MLDNSLDRYLLSFQSSDVDGKLIFACHYPRKRHGELCLVGCPCGGIRLRVREEERGREPDASGDRADKIGTGAAMQNKSTVGVS